MISLSVVLIFSVPSTHTFRLVPPHLMRTFTVPAGVYVLDATLLSLPSKHFINLTEPLPRISAAIQLPHLS